MTAGSIEDLSAALKKALIERALGAELGQHLCYKPGAEKPATATNQRNGHSAKKGFQAGQWHSVKAWARHQTNSMACGA